jgi:hypothetical protein
MWLCNKGFSASGSDIFQFAVTLKAGGAQSGELAKETGVDFGEIETGFALHALL